MVKKRKGRSAAFMRSINPNLRRKKANSIKRKKTKMAKRKKKSYKRSTTKSLNPMSVLIGGGLYGAARGYVSNLLMPITSRIPMGTIADEAALFVVGQQINKRVKDKTLKSVGLAAMAVEAARIGEALRDGSAFASVKTSNGAAIFAPTIG